MPGITSPSPPSLITASICGGLGNQLFQVANLIATSARYDLPMVMERSALSDSVDAPRPTYWGSVFHRFCEVCPPLPEEGPAQEGYYTLPPTRVAIGERRPLGKFKCTIPSPPSQRSQPSPLLCSLPPLSASAAPLTAEADHNLYDLVGFFQSTHYFDDYEALVREILIDPSLESCARTVVEGYGGSDGGGPFVATSNINNTHISATDSSATDSIIDSSSPRLCPRLHHSSACGGDHYIAMHVRRGDYLKYSDTFETLPEAYYDAALRKLMGTMLKRRTGGAGADGQLFGGFTAPNRTLPKPSSSPSPSSAVAAHSPQHFCVDSPSFAHNKASFIKLLIFTDDYAYGRTLAQRLMVRYPGLDAMVVGEETEGGGGGGTRIVVPKTFIPTPLFTEEGNGEQPLAGSAHPLPLPIPIPIPRDVLELYMMAQCDDVIIANSTFSWWGAFMNRGCHCPASSGGTNTSASPYAPLTCSPLPSSPGRVGVDVAAPLGRVVAPLKWFVKEPFPLASHLYAKGWMVL